MKIPALQYVATATGNHVHLAPVGPVDGYLSTLCGRTVVYGNRPMPQPERLCRLCREKAEKL
jgi:hypothetical protein